MKKLKTFFYNSLAISTVFFLSASWVGAAVVGPNNPGVMTVDTSSGAGPGNWTIISPYTIDGAESARSLVAINSTNKYLKLTGFNFSATPIPIGATIDGITVSLTRRSATGEIQDQVLSLVTTGATTTSKADTSIFWPTSYTAKSYGNSTDTWGRTWTPAEINSSAFGFILSTHNTSLTNGRYSYLDGVTMTVNYSSDVTPPVITIGSYSTSSTNQDIVVTASTNEGTLNTSTHTFSDNGTFDFVATDLAGNVATSTVTIANIDKTAPTSTISYDLITPTNTNVIATLHPSEVVTVTNNSGSFDYLFSDNGFFVFNFTDSAGNFGVATATVGNIDRLSPVATFNVPTSPTTLSIVSVIIIGADVDTYKYQLDGATYSLEMSTTSPITISDLSLGAHQLCVIGKDSVGNWQNVASSTCASWTIVAPTPVANPVAISAGRSSSQIMTLAQFTPPQVVLGVKTLNLSRNLGVGAKGLEVKLLQEFLITKALGPWAKKLKKVGPTAYFGPLTKFTLKEYQKKVGIVPVSGYLGPISRTYLKNPSK